MNNKLDNLEGMKKFLELYNLPTPNHEITLLEVNTLYTEVRI